ncbi:MAG: hypothetical protein AAF919_14815 [Pseudomonadota bacterium]
MSTTISFEAARKAKGGSERRTYLMMALIVGVLSLALWVPVGAGAVSDAAPAQPQSVVPQNAALDADAIAKTISERPLFNASRRPPQEAAPAPPPVVTISLVGVINDNQTEIALLRMSNAPGVHRLAVGEQLGKWRVTAITKASVTVMDDEGKVSVMALDGKG